MHTRSREAENRKCFGSTVHMVTAALALFAFGAPEMATAEQAVKGHVMLILRGVANEEYPRGALDDESALEYARRLGFRGEVLDVAGYHAVDSEQVKLALERIHRDDTITAIYAFSAGGYNTRYIWARLTAAERERIRKLVVIGAPGV